MSITQTVIAILTLAFSATPSLAQPTMIKKVQAWGVYAYNNHGKPACYVLTVPKVSMPLNVNHGNNYLIVSRSKGRTGQWAPQARFGYELSQRELTARIGGKVFRMTPRGDTAWALKEGREGELVSAMRNGRMLSVEATSVRGTETRYQFSLAGVTAALKRAETCG